MNNLTFPKLKSKRLILDQITLKDQNHIFSGLSNPEVIRYYGVNYSSLEETEEQMNWYSNLEKSGSGIWWAIRSKIDNEFIGAIGFNDHHPEYKKAEIGFWLLPDFWGKGYMKEAADVVIEYIFGQLKIHRLEAYVESKNINSSKVLKKLGFQHEGLMRDCEVKNGEFISVDLFARINPKE
ncbi:GNAT family N-acetyltransferase [Christiangramia echinicola]|uniref:GNAT family N-acetyltransferase n=1 Tax=Christiangramia echinicola TaxID=279359 RepID=UPI00047EE8EE|nr:GNAT family N-acetyltransferase [Christiangramia echinicola]